MKILRAYQVGDKTITEYTKDGTTVSHITKTPIPFDEPEPEPTSTIEEQILVETQYQTILLEMVTML